MADEGSSSKSVLQEVKDAMTGKEKQKEVDKTLMSVGWSKKAIREAVTTIKVPIVGVMSTADVRKYTLQVINTARADPRSTVEIKATSDLSEVQIAITKYGIVNSGSHQHVFTGYITGPFGSIHAAVLDTVFGDLFRQYLRYFALGAVEILEEDEKLAIAQARKMQIPTCYKNYAFDFALAIPGLPANLIKVLVDAKNRKTYGSTVQSVVPAVEEVGEVSASQPQKASANRYPASSLM